MQFPPASGNQRLVRQYPPPEPPIPRDDRTVTDREAGGNARESRNLRNLRCRDVESTKAVWGIISIESMPYGNPCWSFHVPCALS